MQLERTAFFFTREPISDTCARVAIGCQRTLKGEREVTLARARVVSVDVVVGGESRREIVARRYRGAERLKYDSGIPAHSSWI